MNLKQLTYIITLEEEGSTKGAAKKLDISQSALSKYLLGLEDSLGVSLFVRAQKRLTPTAYGRVYIDAAKQILQVYNFTNQTIASMSSEKKVDFFIGIPPYRDLELIVRLIPEFQKRFPNVTVHIKDDNARNLMEMAGNGAVHMAVINLLDPPEDNIDTIPLGMEEVILAVPSMNPLAASAGRDGHPGAVDLEVLRNQPFILPHSSTAVRSIADSIFAAKKIDPVIVCEVNNSAALLSMVKQGVGCAFIPKSYQDDDTRAVYFSFGHQYFISKVIAYPKGRGMTEMERWFTDAVFDHYRTDKEFRHVITANSHYGSIQED